MGSAVFFRVVWGVSLRRVERIEGCRRGGGVWWCVG